MILTKEFNIDEWINIAKLSFVNIPSNEKLKFIAVNQSTFNYALMDNHKIIGSISLSQNITDNISNNYELNNLAIIEDERGKGYGKYILQTLFKTYHKSTFSLRTKLAGEFYKKIGMVFLYKDDNDFLYYRTKKYCEMNY